MEEELDRLSLLSLKPPGGYQQAELTVGLWNKLGILVGVIKHAYNGSYFPASGGMCILI